MDILKKLKTLREPSAHILRGDTLNTIFIVLEPSPSLPLNNALGDPFPPLLALLKATK